MRIFVSAAEISSDLQAERILKAFQALHPGEPIEWFGIGGPRLRSLPGFRALADAESMRAMGFLEVLTKIRHLRTIRDQVAAELERNPPDAILTFDYPDFHFLLLKRLSRAPWFPGVLRICGIPPKVWVWRRGRIETIRALYHGVWVIFPFEREFYERQGIPAIYEGNPWIATLLKDQTEKAPLIKDGVLTIAVLPGSRDAELKHHLPIIGPALEHLARLNGSRVCAEVPVPAGVNQEHLERELVPSDQVAYRYLKGESVQVLSRNRIGLIKSGTSTLEAAVLGCVPVIFYRMSRVSEWIFKFLVNYLGPVGLPNILLGIGRRENAVFPELVGPEARAEHLATALFRLVEDGIERDRLKAEGEGLRNSLVPVADVPREIARKISSWMDRRPVGSLRRPKEPWIAMISFAWSLLNATRRFLFSEPPRLPVPSILIGNLQAGGSGKTPVVIALAQRALARGFRVGIVSRGHQGRYPEKVRLVKPGDSPATVGDEPAEILAAVPGVHLALSRDRIQAANLLRGLGVNLIIADDGFQNLKFSTDLTVLVVSDAGRSEVVHRDFDSAARGADQLVQVKGTPNSRFHGVRRMTWDVATLPRGPIWIWTAIGDPLELSHFYSSLGLWIERVVSRPDHALPDLEEIKRLLEEASRAGARVAITEKDAVKFPTGLKDRCIILRRKLQDGGVFDEWLDRLPGLQ